MTDTRTAAADNRPAGTPISSIPAMSWFVLALMTVDYVLGMIDRNAVAVLKTTIKGHFQLTDSDYSLLVTAFMVPYAIFYIICGRIVDRYGTRGPFTLFVATWSIATLGCGLATSFQQLVFWRVVLGAAEAGLLPVTIVALVNWFPKDRIAFAYAVKTPFQSLGAILSPPVVAFLALAYGWRAGFIVPGTVGLIFALLWFIFDRNPPYKDAEKPKRASLASVFRSRTLWGIMLVRLVTDPVWFFFQYWQAGYMQERLGASLADVGQLLWLPPVVTSIATFATAGMTERLARKGWNPAGARMRVMQATALLAPLIATLPFIGGIPWFLFVVTTTYLMGFTWLYLSNILMTDLFPKQTVGTAIGVMSFVGTAGAALFNFAVGPVIDAYGYTPVFITLACLHPIGVLLLQYFYRSELRRPERQREAVA